MNPLDILNAFMQISGQQQQSPTGDYSGLRRQSLNSQPIDAKGQTSTTNRSGQTRNFRSPAQSANRPPTLDRIPTRGGQATPPNRPPGGFGQSPGQLNLFNQPKAPLGSPNPVTTQGLLKDLGIAGLRAGGRQLGKAAILWTVLEGLFPRGVGDGTLDGTLPGTPNVQPTRAQPRRESRQAQGATPQPRRAPETRQRTSETRQRTTTQTTQRRTAPAPRRAIPRQQTAQQRAKLATNQAYAKDKSKGMRLWAEYNSKYGQGAVKAAAAKWLTENAS